jgi:hypothetical protein
VVVGPEIHKDGEARALSLRLSKPGPHLSAIKIGAIGFHVVTMT